ncbi:MAG: SDR family oxidoreductase, partial [Planctomycetota bacterium]
ANNRSYAWHIAKALADHGATCAYTCLPGDKNQRRTRKAVDEIQSDAWVHPMDASSDADIDAALDAYREKFDRIDFLIHSIAFADREFLAPGAFHTTTREAYLGAIDISAYTLIGLTRAALPLMTSGGSVLAMSYYGAEKVVPGYNIMGVAKSALECTSRYLAAELGEKGVRVNTISGGYLRTLASSAVGGADDIATHNLTRAPLKRNVEGDDVGKTAVYLVSDLSSGVTGENVYVDCGVNTIGV